LECKHCARYDSDAGKCRDEKLNPGDWGSAITVANVLGVRAICLFNDHRERLVLSRLEALEQFGKGKARFGGPKKSYRWE
jgi:hypothetical protein